MAAKLKKGVSQTEAAKHFGVDIQTIDDWRKKGWLVRYEDRSVDLESTAARVDTLRNPFVGGKPDRGFKPKAALSDFAGADTGGRGSTDAGGCDVPVTASLRGGLRGVAKAAGQSRARIGKKRRGDEFLPEDLKTADAAVIDTTERTLIASCTDGAPTVFVDFEPGACIAGVNKGQFSAWELLAAALDVTGPADVVVCTWTTNAEAVTDLRRLMDAGKITDLRMILDTSLASREPEYCRHIVQQIGNERIRTTRNHAKWCVLTNGRWNLVIRGSMNFGTAPRLEYFEASDDKRLADFLNAIADEMWERAPVWNFESDGEGIQFSSGLAADVRSLTETTARESGRLTVDQVAAEFSLTRHAVTRMRNSGQLTFDDDGCTTKERARDEIRSAGRGLSTPSSVRQADDADGFVDIVEARRLKEVAEAGIAQMKEAQMRGDLIKREDAERVYCDSIAKARANLEAIPNRCAELLVGQTDAAVVRSMLTREIEGALAVVCGEVPSV